MTVLNEHSAAYQWHQRAQQRHPESEQECFELALSQSLKALNDIENFAMQEPYLLEFLASCYANQFWRIHRAHKDTSPGRYGCRVRVRNHRFEAAWYYNWYLSANQMSQRNNKEQRVRSKHLAKGKGFRYPQGRFSKANAEWESELIEYTEDAFALIRDPRPLRIKTARQLKKAYPELTVSELCRVLSLSSSCFYYVKTKTSDDAELRHRIKVIAHESGYTYGKRRVHKELVFGDVSVSLHKVTKLMREMDIYVRYPKRKHDYPSSGKEQKYAPNLLNRQFNPETHNTHWVTDVTYIRIRQGWSYLACVMDLATKEIVGYSVSRSPDCQLTLAALDDAIVKKSPKTRDLLVHSDQGCHFSAHAYRNRLAALKITQSMSRRGNCWDNAVMERFFRSLKSERLNGLSFINHGSVVAEVESYIRFYNFKRRHSGLGYLTPYAMYMQMQKMA